MENTREQSKSPQVEEAERFILGGLRFIKKEEFEKAYNYFRNPQKARRLGVLLDENPRIYIIDGAMTKEKEARALDFCLRNSGFENGDQRTKTVPSISIPEVYTRSLGGRLPRTLWHELSLIGAEECGHMHCNIYSENL